MTKSSRRSARRTLPAALAMGIAAVFATAGDVRAAPAAPSATDGLADAVVTVEAQQFRWSGQAFDTLDALEATVLPRSPRSIALVACGPQAAPALLAAAYRFRHLELHLRSRAVNVAAGCQASTAALREATKPLVDDAAVRTWWGQTMP